MARKHPTKIHDLVDRFEEAVNRHSGEVSCGWNEKDLRTAEREMQQAKKDLLAEIDRIRSK